MSQGASDFSTPMMLQYMEIKKQCSDCLLFFRLGDFYELFLEDAKIGAKILGITLTARPRGKDGDIPMAGVPYHASESYIAKLVHEGYKVAICEQVTLPDRKGIVERAVVRIVTPGTILTDAGLDVCQNNHIVSVTFNELSGAVSVADISTGKFMTTQFRFPTTEEMEQYVSTLLSRFNPSECIVSQNDYEDIRVLQVLKKLPQMNVYPFSQWEDFASQAASFLKKQFAVSSLLAYGIENKKLAQISSAALLGYLQYTQKQQVTHIGNIVYFQPHDSLILDSSTILNLELFSTLHEREKSGSLLHVLDNTQSALGARLLKHWLLHPLKSKQKINQRLDLVSELLINRNIHTQLRVLLSQIYDIERIVAKLSVGITRPVDILNLKISLKQVLAVKDQIRLLTSQLAREIESEIDPKIHLIITLIEDTISDEARGDIRSGGIIKTGMNKDLDKLRSIASGGKEWVAEFEAQERIRTGINSLKVKFNTVFGYYIEVSNAHTDKVPATYHRKQTLVNAERYITEALKNYEDLIIKAEEESKLLEYTLFLEVVKKILTHTHVLQTVAQKLAVVDVLQSFAHISQMNRYTKPTIVTQGDLKLINLRHPVVEKLLGDVQFVPNDAILNTDDKQMMLITGPNMAGKSVYMRSVALAVLLAHIGCFVPASEAQVPITDRIFVRSGASDNITSGLSTFMVEMTQTAHILYHATRKSLIIMDEIGRGTSTYDGISIAWAVAEHLVTTPSQNAMTLFATHYHELQNLAHRYPKKITNYQVAIEDKSGVPVFLHKVILGGASHSFGVAVAQLAGLPKSVIENAKKMLMQLELSSIEQVPKKKSSVQSTKTKHVLDDLRKISIDTTKPIDALQILQKLQKKYT